MLFQITLKAHIKVIGNPM